MANIFYPIWVQKSVHAAGSNLEHPAHCCHHFRPAIGEDTDTLLFNRSVDHSLAGLAQGEKANNIFPLSRFSGIPRKSPTVQRSNDSGNFFLIQGKKSVFLRGNVPFKPD
jgi:hypothetical protein